MSIYYYSNKVQETSTTVGDGNLVLSGATVGYRKFTDSVGANKKISYYIYRTDSNFEWEIGNGYISSSGGVDQLIRETIVASTNSNNAVSFTPGTKYIETIVSEDRLNAGLLNTEEKSSNFTADYAPSTYIIDASSGNVQINLPTVIGKNPIIMGFLLNKTIGDQYQQPNAIQFIPNGTETINGDNTFDISIANDYVQMVSVPSQSGWLLLDPIQDSTNPYGIDGSLQFAVNQAFSGTPQLNWNSSSSSFLIGGTGTLTSADVIIPTSNQTIVFNEQSLDKDFRVEGSGQTHLFFIDGSDNNIGINTSNINDKLYITATNNKGLTIQSSGSGPRISLYNNSVSGIMTDNKIGSIVFSGLNTSNNSLIYSQIYSKVISSVDGSEDSSVAVEVNNNGSREDVAVFSSDGVTLGFNNSNTEGVLIGSASNNEGDNIVLGYYNSVCGSNCVAVGNGTTVSSGTFGGAIGLDHSVSGYNVWVLGGSGLSVSGFNSLYLCLDNSNYLTIQNSGNIKYVTKSDKNTSFGLYNDLLLSSGINQSLSFGFLNNAGVAKTGVLLNNEITSVTNTLENTLLTATVLVDGSGLKVMSLGKDNTIIGNNKVNGVNIVYGTDNIVNSNNNIVYGQDIVVSGDNNILVGHDIMSSGNDAVVFGSNINTSSSGTVASNIAIFGNYNNAYEDFAISIGNYNTSSGLHSLTCGYDNGAHGDYSVAIGENNAVIANGSVAVGRSNILENTSFYSTIFAVGNSNYAEIEETGVLVGYGNSIYGSGGLVFGQSSISSGLNNFVAGFYSSTYGANNIVIGSNLNLNASGSILLGNNKTSNASDTFTINFTNVGISSPNDIIVSGNNIKTYGGQILNYANSGNLINITSSGIYASGTIYTNNSINSFGPITSISGIFTSGSITASGNLGVAGSIVTSSGLAVAGSIVTSGNLSVSGLINSSGTITTSGNIIAQTGIFSSISCLHASSHSASGIDPIRTIISTEYTPVSGTVNNWLPSGLGDIIRISGVGPTGIITGLDSSYNLNKFILVNVGSTGVVQINHESSGSLEANRFMTLNEQPISIVAKGGSSTIFRDPIDNRWRVI